MPRNGMGTYVLPYNWEDDDANDIPIRSDRMQGQDQDEADALTASIANDGQTPILADIPLWEHKITRLSPGTTLTDAATLGQVQNNSANYVQATGVSAYVATPSPALSAYISGQNITVAFLSANVGASTINFNSLGALSLVKDGSTALASGDISNAMRGIVVIDTANSRAHLIPSKIAPTNTLNALAGLRTFVSSGTTAAIPNARYTITGSATVTLPTFLIDEFVIIEFAASTGTTMTVGRNSQTIDGVSADDTCETYGPIVNYYCDSVGVVVSKLIGSVPS